jgi:hypothetical protein
MRAKPSTTILHYNAQAVYNRNLTGPFMELAFTEDEDHLHLMRRARTIDASGLERKRKAAQVEFENRRAEINQEKEAERKRRQAEIASRLEKIVLVTEISQIAGLKVKDIEDHLTIIAQLDADMGIPKFKKDWGQYKDDKANLLRTVLERYRTRYGAFPTRQIAVTDGDTIVQSWDEGMEEDFEMEE